MKRHLPALATMLVLVAAAALWLHSDLKLLAQLPFGAFATAWTSNLYFAFLGVDSFRKLAARDLYLHTWSRGVEEQFEII